MHTESLSEVFMGPEKDTKKAIKNAVQVAGTMFLSGVAFGVVTGMVYHAVNVVVNVGKSG